MLYVRSNVEARVIVDGLPAGETNRLITDLPAERPLTVEVADDSGEYEHFETTVTLRKNCITRVRAALERARIPVRIVTDPPGAEVYIDDEAYPGRTPLVVRVEAGEHNLVIVKEGFRDVVYRGLAFRRSAEAKSAVPGEAAVIGPEKMREISARLAPGRSAYDPFKRLYSDRTKPQRVVLFFGADDRFVLFHNGTQIGAGTDWGRLYVFNVELKEGDMVAAEVSDVSGGVEGLCGFRVGLAIGSYRRDVGGFFRWTPEPYDGWPGGTAPADAKPVRPVRHQLNSEGPRMYWGRGGKCYVAWRVRYE